MLCQLAARPVTVVGCMTNRDKEIWHVSDIYRTLSVMGVLVACVLNVPVCAVGLGTSSYPDLFPFYNFLQ
jgi:hypothetical protein